MSHSDGYDHKEGSQQNLEGISTEDILMDHQEDHLVVEEVHQEEVHQEEALQCPSHQLRLYQEDKTTN
jgi:hypothetical protein